MGSRSRDLATRMEVNIMNIETMLNAADENPAKKSRYAGLEEGRPPGDWDLDLMRSS